MINIVKNFFIIFCLICIPFCVFSQNIVSTNVQGIDCNNSQGYIQIDTDTVTPFYSWYFFDNQSFVWIGYSSGSNLDSIGFFECFSYRVIVYDNNFIPSDTLDVTPPCSLYSVKRAHQNVKCYGDSSGSLKEVVSGGVPFDPDGIPSSGDEYYNYLWYKNGNLLSSGQNDTLLDNLSAGEYVVNVVDSNGCIFQPFDSIALTLDTSVIFQPNKLRVDSLFIDSVNCIGTNTGSFYINIKDGKRYVSGNYYNYYLIDSSNDTIRFIERTGSSINVSTGNLPYYVLFDSLYFGYYTLSVEDSFGCVLDTNILIHEPNNYSLIISNSPSIICEQDSTWLFVDEIIGGYKTVEYNWLGFSHSDSIYVRSGNYSLQIYDTINKCLDTISYFLSAPNTIYTNVTSTNAICFGDNSGTLSIDTIFGGISPYNIQWGGVNPDSLYSGIYTLVLYDSLGCMFTEDYIVGENSDVSINESLYPPSCNGFSDGSISINILGGNPPLSYNWLSGSGSPDSLFAISSGLYIIHITDSLGCFYTDSVYLYEPDSIFTEFYGFQNPLFCRDAITLVSVNISGGTGSYDLVWNNNFADTNYQIVVQSGLHSLSVSDENGCFLESTILISEPDSLEISVNIIQATCNIAGTASVVVAGGTPPYSYIWSNGSTDSISNDLEGGLQWIMVTDSCGDTISVNFTINEYILEVEADYYTNPLNMGEVIVTSSTAQPPFSYQWYNSNMDILFGENESEIFNLCQGVHYVSVVDENNCEVIDSIDVSFYFPMGGIVDELTTTVYPDSLLWGSEPYTYLWDNGEITAHGNICNGLHRVWVTDKNECEVLQEVIVDPIILSLNPSEDLIDCDISNLDLELEVVASGGVGSYSYEWSNGETFNPISIFLYPGLYSVTVTDDNFCIVDTSFNISLLNPECVPNVFSPNDDGVNDLWNIEDAFLFLDSEIKVYGRYGNLVFKSVGYFDPWDGNNMNGNPLRDGTYFYVIKLRDGIDPIKGTVSIIR